MKKYKIKISLPGWYTERGVENIATVKMKVSKSIEVIYDAVAEFEESLFLTLKDSFEKARVQKRINLREILNIHDSVGIRNVRQIKRMLVSIKDGKHTLATSGMPNIKILKTKNNKLFLFDGHHSMLAYMMAGKRYLHQIPYMLIEKKDETRILDDNIYNFFGKHLKFKRRAKWQGYTVNWQAPKRRQLCERAQKNMGELFTIIKGQYNFEQ